MFRNIVVGVDGREGGDDAIALARRLADSDSELILTQVVVTRRFAGRSANRDYDATILAETREALEERRHGIDGIRARVHAIPAASVGAGLAEAAEDHDANLIVVGSCVRGTLGRLLAGNDAQDTIRHAHCPVAVAHRGYAHGEHPALAHIGVGYDESAEAEHALDIAVALREIHHARVEVVEILPPPWPIDMAWAGVPTVHEERKQAESRLLAKPGVDTSRVRVASRAYRELRELASHSDLLVIGARPHSAFGRFAFGSTSDAMAHDLPASLLVVPRVSAPAPAVRPTATAS